MKPSYRDLIVIIILSTLFLTFSTQDQHLPRILLQLLILLLLSYALMCLIDPLFNQKSKLEVVVYSIALSIILNIVLLLISAYTPFEVLNYMIMVVITVTLSVLTIFRRKAFSKRSSSPLEEKAVPKTPKPSKEEVSKAEKKDKTTTRKGSSLDLILVVTLTLLCAIFVLEPTLNKTPLRTILGLLLVLFFPGYALISSLFPKRDDLDTIERLALSFGLSIAVTPLIGLGLNYTPFGIRLDPILISLTGITLLLCLVGYLRRRRTPKDSRFSVDFAGFLHVVTESFQGESRTGKILSVILILSIVLAISTTAYIIVKPTGESFTEFYILGPDGKASDYPTKITPGGTGNLIIGVVNHENKETSYRVLVSSNNTVQMEQQIKLKSGEKIEIPFNFTAGELGEMKMEFLLFKLPENNNVYRSLHLWLNMTDSPSEVTESDESSQ